MAEYDFIKMQKKLAKYLDEDRYEHVQHLPWFMTVI